MIDVRAGRLMLANGVTLDASFDANALRSSSLASAVRPMVANPPWHTATAEAQLSDGIPVNITMVFHHGRLAQVSMRFRYAAEVDESLVHEQHAQWLTRTLGAPPYVYDWGVVELAYDPRNDESDIIMTWRGASPLHDGVMPPAPGDR